MVKNIGKNSDNTFSLSYSSSCDGSFIILASSELSKKITSPHVFSFHARHFMYLRDTQLHTVAYNHTFFLMEIRSLIMANIPSVFWENTQKVQPMKCNRSALGKVHFLADR